MFYKITYDKAISFKREECTWGKVSVNRITEMVAANPIASEKKKLLVMRESKTHDALRILIIYWLCIHITKKHGRALNYL